MYICTATVNKLLMTKLSESYEMSKFVRLIYVILIS